MEAIKTAGFLLSAASSYVALLYKLCQIRRGWRDPAYITLVITLALQCLTFSMGAVSASSETFLGVRNLAILVMHVAAVSFCITAQVLMLQWANPLSEVRRKIRLWLQAGAGLNALLVALFFIGDAPAMPREALATGTDHPVLLVYLLLFIVSQAIPCVTIYRLCRPYAKRANKAWLRRALNLLSVGAVVLFLYCATRTVNIVTPLLGIDIGMWTLLPTIFSPIGIVVLSIGLTMPSWGVHVSRLAAWMRDYASYRALYPLWHSLYESSPGIALEPPSSSVSDLHYRLHRRVVEIRDGWRALRPYMETVDTSAAEDGDEARQAFAEAMRIKRALHAKKSGAPPRTSPETDGFDGRDAKTFAAEVTWLKRVSAAYGQIDR